MLRNKSDQDQIQDFIWAASRAKISLDTDDVIQAATSTNVRLDASNGKYAMSLDGKRIF
jgi:hypothetical protein